MNSDERVLHRGLPLLWLLSVLASFPVAAQPSIELRIPNHAEAAFPNFSSVAVPANGLGPLEIWLQGALGEIQVSSVRVTLNEHPFTPFVAINPLPAGVRVILKLGSSLRPEYRLRTEGENVLSFVASDETRVTYEGRFYVVVDAETNAPSLRPTAHPSDVSREVALPDQAFPPDPVFTTDWPERTSQKTLLLAAEIADRQGLRRVVIEVNGKDVEEVVLENEMPVRKKGGFRSSGKLPGEVTGDSRLLAVSLPVELKEGINVVALRAENVSGLRKRVDRTLERVKPSR
jgi:hypothetical protein